MTTYNHAFDIAFSVPGNDHPSGDNVTATDIRKAIFNRLTMHDDELLEAVGFPFDTYEEDDLSPLTPDKVPRWKRGKMSDLTDRLRNDSKCAEEEFGHPAEELLEWQAADRIEHLEAALTRISMMEGESEPRNKRFYRDFARAALK